MSPHWYRTLDAYRRRVFWLTFGGFTVNALNIQLYAFVLPALLALWGLSHAQAGLVASVALVSSAAGGWSAGLLADRWGRARMLRCSIVGVALATVLCGLAGSFEQLLVARAVQGFCFGADLAVGAVFIGEMAPAAIRGRMAGTAQSGWAVGWGLAAMIATALLAMLPPDIGWRATFVAGLLPTLPLLIWRRQLREPEAFLRSQRDSSWRAIFAGAALPSTLKGTLIAAGMHSGYWAIATWWPAMLHVERGLSTAAGSLYLGVLIAGALAGYVFGAWLSDTAGRRMALGCFAIGGLLIALVYLHLPVSDTALLALSAPLGFVATGIFGVIGPALTELYPTELRGAGLGFCYNCGRGLAGTTPALIGISAGQVGVGQAVGLYVACAYGLVLAMALLLPETRGSELKSLSDTGS